MYIPSKFSMPMSARTEALRFSSRPQSTLLYELQAPDAIPDSPAETSKTRTFLLGMAALLGMGLLFNATPPAQKKPGLTPAQEQAAHQRLDQLEQKLDRLEQALTTP